MVPFQKERILWVFVFLWVFLRMDFWGWHKVEPFIFRWIPYNTWYHAILIITGIVFYAWWSHWGWPDPPQELFDEGGE